MNGNYHHLPEPDVNEPPHQESYLNKKWPSPRFGRREPDELLVDFMEYYEIDPSDYRNRRSRYQYVRTYGKFRCADPYCLKKDGGRSFWTSGLTSVRFDMFKQTVRLFGQKCKKCRGTQYGGRYCYPLPFKYLCDSRYAGWRDICLEAIDKAEQRRYMTDDILDENLDDGIFSSMTEEEQQNLIDSIVSKEPHQKTLCQRCKERDGPCWVPHKPEECSRCQKDRRGLCYNPKHFQ